MCVTSRSACLVAFAFCFVLPQQARAQLYSLETVELGHGYAIADGSTIKIIDGEVVDWSIGVEGEYPFRFEHPGDIAKFEVMTPSGQSPFSSFLLSTNYVDDQCIGTICEANLGWDEDLGLNFGHIGVIQGNGDFNETVFGVTTTPVQAPAERFFTVVTVPEPAATVLSLPILWAVAAMFRSRRGSKNS